MSLEGTFVFWCLIASPAFRRSNSAQVFQARMDRTLSQLAWLSLLVAALSGAAWLVIVGSNMSGTPLAAVLHGPVLGIVLTQTRFGTDWEIRAGLAAVVALCLLVRGRSRGHVAAWIGLPCAAAFVAALAWAGHGAATEQVPFDALHLPADILHLLAAGAWLGALLPLVLLLVRARRDGDPEALGVAQMATLRFSTLGLTCVGTLIVTGIVNTWFLSGSVPALLGTLYGQLLLLKIALFAAMIAVAGVNQRRLLPALANIGGDAAVRLRAIRKVGRNAALEASLGIGVLAIVGIIGILTPGAHTEPRWPLPFRFDLGEVAPGRQIVLYIAVAAFIVSLAAIAFAVEKRRYREMAAGVGFLVVFAVVGCRALRPGIVDAYPTSFYASTQAYAAPSISRGAPLYAQNCAVCHGANGRGGGPLSAKLPIRPADLTEPHLFAHKVGELYWWVSNGRDNGVMPGFADKLNPDQRWDLINFLLARAAGALTKNVGPQISTAAAPPLPDFAFERDGVQNTLSQTLKEGPALLILFRTPAPRARLDELAHLKQRFAAAGLHVVAVPLDQWKVAAPFIVQAADDARATLALFRSRTDGGETELMLDRGGNVRARWTASGAGGLADPAILLADALRVAKIPVAAANHAGHGH